MRGPDPLIEPSLVWYAGYGSNLHPARFACYLAGGTPAGALRGSAGAREPAAPLASRPIEVPGGIFFATESVVWGGGRAFYDPELLGTTTAMRAYLITRSQFSDVVAQEMYGRTGVDLELAEVLTHGRAQLGPGRYETVLRLPSWDPPDAVPVLTFTSPWGAHDVPGAPPSSGYLLHLALGLQDAHGWTAERIGDYLAAAPGAAGTWDGRGIAELLTGAARR